MRSIAVVIVVIVCSLAARAEARLWETKSQLDARLGKPFRVYKDPAGDIYTYRFKQFEVLVTFLDRKSQSELYLRSDDRPLTREEIQDVLAANLLPGTNWRTTEGVLALVRKAGGRPIAVGAYSPDAHPPVFGVCTAQFVKTSAWIPRNKNIRR